MSVFWRELSLHSGVPASSAKELGYLSFPCAKLRQVALLHEGLFEKLACKYFVWLSLRPGATHIASAKGRATARLTRKPAAIKNCTASKLFYILSLQTSKKTPNVSAHAVFADQHHIILLLLRISSQLRLFLR